MINLIFIFGPIVLIIAMITYIIYQIYRLRAASNIPYNEHQIRGSQDNDCLHLFKETLYAVREDSNLEKRMIGEIEKVFASHKIKYHTGEYLDLIARGDELKGKTDKKSKIELVRLMRSKKKCIKNMPKITPEEEKPFNFIFDKSAVHS
jgi:hypothetical protein